MASVFIAVVRHGRGWSTTSAASGISSSTDPVLEQPRRSRSDPQCANRRHCWRPDGRGRSMRRGPVNTSVLDGPEGFVDLLHQCTRKPCREVPFFAGIALK